MTKKPKAGEAESAEKTAEAEAPAPEAEATAAAAEAAEPAAEAAGGAAQQPALVINAQYVKDLSFEAPGAPDIFSKMAQQQPDIAINIDVQARRHQDSNVCEVDLHLKAECKVGATVAFIMELVYGGLFTINVPADQLQPVLLIECPRLLFPFARSILANASRDGGFPPLLLGPVDFVALYQRQLEKVTQSAQAGGGGNGGGSGTA